jgi:predicted XRE-type DNA-binding protein
MNSYDNAFSLLTDDAQEAEGYKVLSGKMNEVIDLIKLKGWSITDAAKHLGVSEATISDLQNGRLSKLSLSVVNRMLIK